jgi:hypothetical protein
MAFFNCDSTWSADEIQFLFPIFETEDCLASLAIAPLPVCLSCVTVACCDWIAKPALFVHYEKILMVAKA